ncbi:hypothetical protein [Streptomyces sp. NPDC046727]|uniref:hypothetical protein n=1 Tax=Streptomyces sp. NPDC046727 TaxID=3155373 RepID=UPI0033F11076
MIRATRALALLLAATALAGCERGSSNGPRVSTTGPSGCPATQARAEAAVTRAERTTGTTDPVP